MLGVWSGGCVCTVSKPDHKQTFSIAPRIDFLLGVSHQSGERRLSHPEHVLPPHWEVCRQIRVVCWTGLSVDTPRARPDQLQIWGGFGADQDQDQVCLSSADRVRWSGTSSDGIKSGFGVLLWQQVVVC